MLSSIIVATIVVLFITTETLKQQQQQQQQKQFPQQTELLITKQQQHLLKQQNYPFYHQNFIHFDNNDPINVYLMDQLVLKMADGGHTFVKKNFHKPTYCHHCSDILWFGLIGQGYICEGK